MNEDYDKPKAINTTFIEADRAWVLSHQNILSATGTRFKDIYRSAYCSHWVTFWKEYASRPGMWWCGNIGYSSRAEAVADALARHKRDYDNAAAFVARWTPPTPLAPFK
jgi:hypothetical protein